MSKIAVILIRGRVGVRKDALETLDSLHLQKKHSCAVFEDSPSLQGKLKKVASLVAYGPISEDIYTLLVEKRKSSHENVFFLAPPKGGFARKGVKKSFSQGGALGNYKEEMGALVQRMI